MVKVDLLALERSNTRLTSQCDGQAEQQQNVEVDHRGTAVGACDADDARNEDDLSCSELSFYTT